MSFLGHKLQHGRKDTKTVKNDFKDHFVKVSHDFCY